MKFLRKFDTKWKLRIYWVRIWKNIRILSIGSILYLVIKIWAFIWYQNSLKNPLSRFFDWSTTLLISALFVFISIWSFSFQFFTKLKMAEKKRNALSKPRYLKEYVFKEYHHHFFSKYRENIWKCQFSCKDDFENNLAHKANLAAKKEKKPI